MALAVAEETKPPEMAPDGVRALGRESQITEEQIREIMESLEPVGQRRKHPDAAGLRTAWQVNPASTSGEPRVGARPTCRPLLHWQVLPAE